MRSDTTTRVHGGHAGSSGNTSCACHGESPLFRAHKSGASLPSGMRSFKKATKQAQNAASQSAVSGAATPPPAASLPVTPPAVCADGLPSVRTSLGGMRIFKRSRSVLSQSTSITSSPSITSTAIVPLQRKAPAVPATRTSTRTEPIVEISEALSLMKSPSKASKSLPDQSASERRVVLHETEGPTHLVPYNAGGAAPTPSRTTGRASFGTCAPPWRTCRCCLRCHRTRARPTHS